MRTFIAFPLSEEVKSKLGEIQQRFKSCYLDAKWVNPNNVHVTLTADRDELNVGDPVQLTLEVIHPADFQVIIPKLGQTWGNFEVRGQSPATTTPNEDGTATTRATIEVTLFYRRAFKELIRFRIALWRKGGAA